MTTTSDDDGAGKFARPTMTRQCRAINRLYKTLGKGQPALIEAEAEIGEHYAEIRRVLGFGSDLMKEWVAENLPGVDERHLRRCVELHRRHDDFEAANKWYQREGRALGWRTPHATGCRYALDVIRFRAKHQDGHEPPVQKTARSTRPTNSVAHLTALLDQRDAEITALKKALQEAEWQASGHVCAKCSGTIGVMEIAA
jgi:hypothetical protein